MLRNFTILLFVLGFILNANAQKVAAKLVDKENNNPIPYATIQFSKNEGIMSNEEGIFEFEKPENTTKNDSIKISSLGFKTKSFSLQDSLPKTIYLDEEVFEIAPVVLTNKKISADEIIAKVRENLSSNYNNSFVKSQVFIRATENTFNKKFDFNIKKSTIAEIDEQLMDEVTQSVPKSFTSFKEIFANAYHNSKETKIQNQKGLLMQNASEIGSTDEIQEKLKTTFEKAIKPNSYLVFKTGVFKIGQTEVMDSMKKKQEISIGKSKNEDDKKNDNDDNKLNRVFSDLFTNPKSELNFLSEYKKYIFEKESFVKIGNSYAIVLNFKPKRKEKYKGKIYVNIDDYAIVRADIEGAKKIFDKQFNMLGVHVNELSYKSTVMFVKDNSHYNLFYYKKQSINSVGMDRNFKVIEKNKFVKGRNKQNELKFQLDLRLVNHSKIEIVQSNISSISASSFNQIEPNKDFELVEKKTYPSDFWNGYNILTPEKAIKELKIED